MTIYWGDLNARARGLGTHLLGRGALTALAAAPERVTLADRLGYEGDSPDPSGGVAPSLELMVRRSLARRLATLARWAGRRTKALVVIFEDEDRRSLRALVRGALQGAAGETRLTGLVPTPSIPEHALRALASLNSAVNIARALVGWGNPYGAAIIEETARSQPDLLRLDALINRTFAERALAASRRVTTLRAHVRRVIDLENVHAALGVAARGGDASLELCFVEGGDILSRHAYDAAAGAGAPHRAALELAGTFTATPYGAVLARYSADISRLEGPLLAAQIAEVDRMRRLDPLSPAPLLVYALRLRAEALDIRRIMWGAALGASQALIASDLVSPP